MKPRSNFLPLSPSVHPLDLSPRLVPLIFVSYSSLSAPLIPRATRGVLSRYSGFVVPNRLIGFRRLNSCVPFYIITYLSATMSSRQQIDSVIDDDDEFWYLMIYPWNVHFVADYFKPPLYRRIRPLRQELQALPLWISGMRYILTAPFDLSRTSAISIATGMTSKPDLTFIHRSANFATTISKPTMKKVDAPTAAAPTMRALSNIKSPMRRSEFSLGGVTIDLEARKQCREPVANLSPSHQPLYHPL